MCPVSESVDGHVCVSEGRGGGVACGLGHCCVVCVCVCVFMVQILLISFAPGTR